MIIDAHSHMNPISLLEWLNERGGTEGKRRAAVLRRDAQRKPHAMDVGQRLAQLDRNNIDYQVVTPGGSGGLYGRYAAADRLSFAKALNEGMAKLMDESKGRLIAGGTVPLIGFRRGSAKEMTRAVRELGLKLITVPSHIKGKPLDMPEFEPFWAQAAEMGVPVYIHPSSPTQHRDRPYEGEYDLSHVFGLEFETLLSLSRLGFSGIMERYPPLTIVSHHLGGGLPFWMGRIRENYDRTNPKHEEQAETVHRVLSKTLSDYFAQFYYDTAVGGNAPAILCAYEVFGADQLLFATDAPNGPGSGEVRLATYPKIIKSLGLSDQDNRKIFADNARRILKLK